MVKNNLLCDTMFRLKLLNYFLNIMNNKKNSYKKVYLSLLIIFVITFLNINYTFAKTTVKAKVVATKTTMKWTADGLRAVGSIQSFGYNYGLRNAIIKKIENYAKKKHIKVITASVVNKMDE